MRERQGFHPAHSILAVNGTYSVTRVSLGGAPGVRITAFQAGFPVLLWVRRNGDPWVHLEPFVPTALSGYVFTVIEPDLGPVVAGNVPAVSTWGLLVLACSVMAAGTILAIRKQRLHCR